MSEINKPSADEINRDIFLHEQRFKQAVDFYEHAHEFPQNFDKVLEDYQNSLERQKEINLSPDDLTSSTR